MSGTVLEQVSFNNKLEVIEPRLEYDLLPWSSSPDPNLSLLLVCGEVQKSNIVIKSLFG